MASLHRDLDDILGPTGVLTDPSLTVRYSTDWTGAYVGSTPLVARPASTSEVAGVIDACRHHGAAIVPQGGNTGLVAGGVPRNGEIVLSTERLVAPPRIDPLTGIATVVAGTTIQQLRDAARTAGWNYGVDLASRGSATVGGTIATNAGGLRVLRYGDTRAQLIGIEAVLGDGSTISQMRELTRNNSGYHFPSLLAGSEGTLGVVTAAILRLVPLQTRRAVALLSFNSLAHAIEGSQVARRLSSEIEAIELMTAAGMGLVAHVKNLTPPLAPAPAYLLIELAGKNAHDDLLEMVATLPDVVDAAVAEGTADDPLWVWRESHTEAINTLGPPLKLDVTLPIGALADFIGSVSAIVRGIDPAGTPWFFGHVADGNVHVNVTGLSGAWDETTDGILHRVADLGGSISTEHGIGRAKRSWLRLTRTEAEISAMRRVKRAMDPDSVLNPKALL